MNSQPLTTHCKEQIAIASQMLRKSLETVKSQFQHNEIRERNNPCKKGKAQLLEIRFEKVTFNCLFGYDNICYATFLFFDNQYDICDYIQYCRQTYQYDAQSYNWVGNNCYIWLYTEKNEVNLVFSYSKPINT